MLKAKKRNRNFVRKVLFQLQQKQMLLNIFQITFSTLPKKEQSKMTEEVLLMCAEILILSLSLSSVFEFVARFPTEGRRLARFHFHENSIVIEKCNLHRNYD